MSLVLLALSVVLSAVPEAPATPAPALSKEEALKLLKVIDQQQKNTGDYKALAYMEQKERDKADVAYEAVIYRRSADEKLMIMFLKPKAEQGKGYLRIDKNLWMYDPSVGKWERRTERERIAGTGSRRRDFDESRFAEDYDPESKGQEKLGAFDALRLRLTAKEGVDVAYPVIELWVDKATNLILKAQEFALSGRLMRTSLYPSWQKIFSEDKKGDVWFPQKIYFYDEVDKANSTIVIMKSVDLRPLEANLFTKAWLESKSR